MIYWILLIISLIAIDQLTKAWVVSAFEHVGDTFPVIQDFFHFTYVRNSGAVFGLGGDITDIMWVFIIIAILAAVVLGYFFFTNDFKDKRRVIYTLAISLLIAGTFGNFIDRLFQPDHMVVDFIDFRGIWNYVFNVADMCLNVGIVLFVVDLFFLEPKRVKKA